jgi:arylamine N-acetyltransferase
MGVILAGELRNGYSHHLEGTHKCSRVHIVNIVTLANGTKYMVDVGFGGDGATKPLPLIDGHIERNLGTQDIRLVHDTIPDQVDQSKPLWIYQYRNSPDADWNSYYAFPEVEFLEVEFGILNFWTSQSPDSFQTTSMLVVKFQRNGDRIVGKKMLFNHLVKENPGGKTRLVQELRTEEERIEALEVWFGLVLTEEERLGIRGHCTELGRAR